MLVVQEKFSSYLKMLRELLSETDFLIHQERLQQVLHAELLVPVIGAFSAGKSTLLNAFIEIDILPVGIAPETELATELRYSPEPYVLAVKKDGSEERHSIDALIDINKRSAEYLFVRLFINSPVLKDIVPLVLVDMPGYGSSLENHNKALSYYLPKGVHFIVVTSIEDGNITRAIIGQLEEAQEYGGDFTFVISKSNLRAPEQIEDVRRYINEQIATYFSAGHQAVPVGDKDVKILFEEIKKVDSEKLFSGIYLPLLKNENNELLNNVILAMNVIRRDARESEKDLQELEKAMNYLLDKKADAEQETRSRYSRRLLDSALKSVDHALNNAVDELTMLAINRNNRNTFENHVSEIIRSSLAKTFKREGNDISAAMIDGLTKEISIAFPDMPHALTIGEDLHKKILIQSDKVSTWLEQKKKLLSQGAGEEERENEPKGKDFLLTLINIAEITDPIISALILFLPDVLALFQKQAVKKRARENLVQEVFPNIKASLRNVLAQEIDERLNNMLAGIAAEFEVAIGEKRQVIENYQKAKKENSAKENDQLSRLENLYKSIESLAEQYLSERP